MKKKILIVDDEAEIRDLVQGWLSYLNYEVITAKDGDEGLAKMASEKPDLVIMDALMPGRTGYQLAEDLKNQSEELKKIPVIMISGRESMRDIAGDFYAFVAKPFDPKVLLEKIKGALKETS